MTHICPPYLKGRLDPALDRGQDDLDRVSNNASTPERAQSDASITDHMRPMGEPVRQVVARAVAASIGDPSLIRHLSDLSIDDLAALAVIFRAVAAAAEQLRDLPANDLDHGPRIDARPGRRIVIITQYRMPGAAQIDPADDVVIEDVDHA